MAAVPHDHAHDHGHGHDHHHHVALDPSMDSAFWVSAAEAYNGLRTANQLLAGMQLLGVDHGAKSDLRKAVLLRVQLLLAEVHDRLRELSTSGDHDQYLRELMGCCDFLELIAGQQRDQLSLHATTPSPETTLRLLQLATDRLRRCERYDLGLRFFGSGGCADIEHALSHLQIERPTRG